MTQALKFFVDAFYSVINVLEGVQFDMYGVTVNLAGVIFAFIAIGIVVSVMWKGAQG